MTTTLNPPPAPPTDGASPSGNGGGNGGSRRIAGATGIMMAGILGSRILGLLRESVIAHKFGQDRLTDVYNAAFTIPDLLFFLIAGGALSGAFIPVFTEYIATNRERDAWRIFSVVASVMTIVVSVFIVLGEIFAVPLVILTNPGYVHVAPDLHGLQAFSAQFHAAMQVYMGQIPMPDKVARTVTLTRIVLPAQICFFLGGLMMGALQGKGNFWGQALGPIVYNGGIILGGLFLTRSLGIAGLCWGAVGGAIVGNLGLQWYLMRKNGGIFMPGGLRKYWRHEGVVKVWKLMLPVILGLALPQVSTIIGRMFASTLGDGPQTALMNANKLMQVPLGVFAQATAIAIFPTMAAQAARKEIGQLRKSVNYGIRSILFLTIPSSMLMWVLALPFVQLVFQSGHFTTANAELAADALRWFAIGIFAWSAHSVITRGFYALQDSRTPVIVGTVVTLIFIPLNGPLKSRMGVSGLALATSIAATIHMLSMLFLLRRRLNGLEGGRLLFSLSRILVASGAATALCWFIYRHFAHQLQSPHLQHARAHAFVALTVCLSLSSVAYLVFAILLRMNEVAVFKKFLLPLQKILRRRLAR